MLIVGLCWTTADAMRPVLPELSGVSWRGALQFREKVQGIGQSDFSQAIEIFFGENGDFSLISPDPLTGMAVGPVLSGGYRQKGGKVTLTYDAQSIEFLERDLKGPSLCMLVGITGVCRCGVPAVQPCHQNQAGQENE
jgi:hypothetical protein